MRKYLFISSDNSEISINERSEINRGNSNNSKLLGKSSIQVHINLNVSELLICGRNEGYIFRFETMSKEALANYLNAPSNTKINESSNINQTQTIRKKISNILIANNNIFLEHAVPEVNLKIDKSFIPESANHFMLDTKLMSYVMNPKNVDQIKDFIKDEANKKIRKEPKLKDSEANSSWSESQSDSQYSDSQISQDGNKDSKSEKSFGLGSGSNSNNNNNKRNSYNSIIKKKISDLNEYYKVNMNPIKFLFYDFTKEALVEIIDNNKISQMEQKKTEDFRKKEQHQEENKNKQAGAAKKALDNPSNEAAASSGRMGEAQEETELDEFSPTIDFAASSYPSHLIQFYKCWTVHVQSCESRWVK